MSRENDKYFTPVHMTLKDLAANDWPTFCDLLGEPCIETAIICILRSRGNTLGQISNKYDVKKRRVQLVVENKCKCDIISKIK